MAMTITEKIIAAHCGEDTVRPGQFVYAKVDFCLGNDITAPISIKELERIGVTQLFDTSRIGLIPDHFTPNKDIKSAGLVAQMREFSK